MLASQLVPTDPLADGMLIPCAATHDNSCGSVRRTMVQRIHLPVRPFMWKLIPPSCRRFTPAAASVQNAAGTARSNSNWRRSSRNCGTGIVVYSCSVDTLRLCDEALGHAPESGDDHQRNTGDAPTHVAATALEVPASDTQASDGDDRSDDVATPVHDVEDRA